ncbi:LysR family transcriptional regulator [Kaarinaea lacus]
MDIETLRLFVEVMQKQNFTEVAKLHGVAPSSVSRSIAALESELGIRLLQRSTRKLEPTESGLLYYERLSPLLDELESAVQFATDISREPQGNLRISTGVAYGENCITPLLPEFTEQYPALSVELILSDAYLDLIEERVDIAVRLGTLKSSSHIARRLSDMTFHVCASPAYLEKYGQPYSPNELAEHECLLFPRTGYNFNWLFKDKQGTITEIEIKGKYLVTNSNAIRSCCLDGMGITLLPDWLINKHLSSGELVSLFTDYQVTATDFDSAIWLIHPSREYLPTKTRVFRDFMLEKYKLIA